MHEEVIIAGFGGQGVMLIGEILSYAAMIEGKHVSWVPSYGPEMRGGTANCQVVIADSPIASPLVFEPASLIALNGPSLDAFAERVRPGGVILYNSTLASMTGREALMGNLGGRKVQVFGLPASHEAALLGEPRVANMILLGGYLALVRPVSIESVMESLRHVIPERRHNLIPLNERALARGAESVTDGSCSRHV